MYRQMPLIIANQVSKFGVIECETVKYEHECENHNTIKKTIITATEM